MNTEYAIKKNLIEILRNRGGHLDRKFMTRFIRLDEPSNTLETRCDTHLFIAELKDMEQENKFSIVEKTILYRYPHGYFEGGVEKRTTYPSLLKNQAGSVNISKVEMEETKEKNSNHCIVEDSEGKRYKLRIRKLTPKECLRLMDVRDEDADKMLEANSKSQVYKQAGNSIVVACMEKIFHNLFISPQPEKQVVRMRQIPMF